MTTYAVLLRGVNVGGHNRLPMADLRTALASAGMQQARTYIQSGNIVVDADDVDPEIVAARVRSVIATAFHLDVPAVAMTAVELGELAAANPFADEPDLRRVHAIVLPSGPTPEMVDAVAARVAASAAKGARDDVRIVGRTAYLHTPDGFGSSDLARALSSARSNPLSGGTARNWATVTALLALCHG